MTAPQLPDAQARQRSAWTPPKLDKLPVAETMATMLHASQVRAVLGVAFKPS